MIFKGDVTSRTFTAAADASIGWVGRAVFLQNDGTVARMTDPSAQVPLGIVHDYDRGRPTLVSVALPGSILPGEVGAVLSEEAGPFTGDDGGVAANAGRLVQATAGDYFIAISASGRSADTAAGDKIPVVVAFGQLAQAAE